MTLSDLAIHMPASIQLFEKYDLNYYQNGRQKLRDACEENGLNYSEIDAELNSLQQSSKVYFSLTLEDLSIDRLIDFINGQHHSNEVEVLTYLEEQIRKSIECLMIEDQLLPILKEVEEKFSNLKEKLIKHCEKEDEILFPYMRKLYELRHDKVLVKNLQKNLSVKNPLLLLESEHVQVINVLSEIKKITNKFFVPVNASKEYRMLIEHLKEFENDFHIHLHIENNILFPKFKALEDKLNNNLNHQNQ